MNHRPITKAQRLSHPLVSQARADSKYDEPQPTVGDHLRTVGDHPTPQKHPHFQGGAQSPPNLVFLHPIQAKMILGGTRDPYEQEADRVAKQVVNQIHGPIAPSSTDSQFIQGNNSLEETCYQSPEISTIQRREVAPTDTAEEAIPSNLETSIHQAQGNGHPLPDDLQTSMEQAFGTSFEHVRVHTDGKAEQLNHDLHAKAFTIGPHIFFRRGAFQPELKQSQELVAHELTHVVQQTGSEGTIQRQYDPPPEQQVTKAKTYAMKSIWYEAALQVLTELQTSTSVRHTTPADPAALKSFGSSPNLLDEMKAPQPSARPSDQAALKSFGSSPNLLDVSQSPPPVRKKPPIPPKPPLQKPPIPAKPKALAPKPATLSLEPAAASFPTSTTRHKPVPLPKPRKTPPPVAPKPKQVKPELPTSSESGAMATLLHSSSTSLHPMPPPVPQRISSLTEKSTTTDPTTLSEPLAQMTVSGAKDPSPTTAIIRGSKRQASLKLDLPRHSRFSTRGKRPLAATVLSPGTSPLETVPESKETDISFKTPVYSRSVSGASKSPSSDSSTPVSEDSLFLGIHPKARFVVSPISPALSSETLSTPSSMFPMNLKRQASQTERLFDSLQYTLDVLKAPGHANDPLSEDPLLTGRKKLEHLFPKHEPQDLASRISEAMGVSEAVVWQQMTHAYIRIVNNQRNWAPIIKQINFGTAETPDYYTSYIYPVNASFHPTYGPEGKNYGTTGLGSISAGGNLTLDLDQKKEVERATNLAYTALWKGPSSQPSELLFEAFRSGVSSGKKFKDPEQQMLATRSHIHETLEAMLIRYIQWRDPEEQEKILSGQAAPTVPIAFANLESIVIPGERKQTDQQDEVLKEFSKGYHAFKFLWPSPDGGVRRISIKAKFRIRSYNFGVNAQGTGWFQDNDEVIAELLQDANTYLESAPRLKETEEQALFWLQVQHRQWSSGEPVGEEAMAALEGKMASTRARISMLENKMRKIRQLRDRIAKRQGEYRSYEQERSVAMLEFLLGSMYLFHCKSGKDRTGFADVENKHLARVMDKTLSLGEAQLVPSYDFATQVEQDDFLRMLWESGNLELQTYNTGGQGYKIAPTALNKRPLALSSDLRLTARVGGADALKRLQGLKRYTGATYF